MHVNFLIGGTEPAGTNQLCTLLMGHPGVCMPRRLQPEPNFFSKQVAYERGVDYYHQTHFPHAAGRTALIGEKSGRYLWHPRAAERIHAYNPGMKLIFILRDPVDRAWSNHRFNCLNGLEPLDFDTALAAEAARTTEMSADPVWKDIQPFAYFDKGLYATQLRRYYDRFDPGCIHLVHNRDLREAPARTIDEVLGFLGLPPLAALPQDSSDFRSFGTRSRRVQAWLRRRAPALLERAIMKKRGRRPAGLLERLVQCNLVDRQTQPPAATVEQLRERYNPEMRDLSDLTGLTWFARSQSAASASRKQTFSNRETAATALS